MSPRQDVFSQIPRILLQQTVGPVHKDPALTLPPEVFCMIMNRLSHPSLLQACLVSRAWCEHAITVLWKLITADVFSHVAEGRRQNYAKLVQELSLRPLWACPMLDLSFSTLRILRLWNQTSRSRFPQRDTGSDIEYMSSHTRMWRLVKTYGIQLETLFLGFSPQAVTSEDLLTLLEDCKALSRVGFSAPWNSLIDLDILVYLATRPILECLSLPKIITPDIANDLLQLTNEPFLHYKELEIITGGVVLWMPIMAHCTRLELLHLRVVDRFGWYNFQSLSTLKQLKSFGISFAEGGLVSESMLSILGSLPRLRRLHFSSNQALQLPPWDERQVTKYLSQCPCLESLSITQEGHRHAEDRTDRIEHFAVSDDHIDPDGLLVRGFLSTHWKVQWSLCDNGTRTCPGDWIRRTFI
ncbi:hypothetical protein K461DRAFT_303825 [Myriangium duriaei CBS 260.36]|uniref:F-box domain-containing protein n=1 Tax=Myriangium duriaei CBS 260.36 TaxID=1168546 RepID=A0A9P4JAQ1_9PEZI|nr:hypothetical protein K461DRAFT_303825 [Myriangium duriaei CBS 260.36]